MKKKSGLRLAKRSARLHARSDVRIHNRRIHAYYNHMEQCPHTWWSKERKVWKKANPTFEFNGITYHDDWSPQLSNSGKTKRWRGYLIGSDGSSLVIKDEHINNRRNDPERNWAFQNEQHAKRDHRAS